MVLKFNPPHRKITNQRLSRRLKRQQKDKKKLLWGLGLLGLTLCSWVSYYILKGFLTKPEGILVLGGHEEREIFAASFAKDHPDLPIWVSGGSPENYAHKIFAKQGINSDRLKLDYHAVDTVTNFTTLVDEMKKAGIDNVYLITSENHLYRAEIIGLIVFGSQGIAIHPISVPSQGSPESVTKCIRDGLRAMIWVFTGETGANLKEQNLG